MVAGAKGRSGRILEAILGEMVGLWMQCQWTNTTADARKPQRTTWR